MTFRSLLTLESQFKKLSGIKPSDRAEAKADCRIPEVMKFQSVILRRLKKMP
jgi:hypothetical protein